MPTNRGSLSVKFTWWIVLTIIMIYGFSEVSRETRKSRERSANLSSLSTNPLLWVNLESTSFLSFSLTSCLFLALNADNHPQFRLSSPSLPLLFLWVLLLSSSLLLFLSLSPFLCCSPRKARRYSAHKNLGNSCFDGETIIIFWAMRYAARIGTQERFRDSDHRKRRNYFFSHVCIFLRTLSRIFRRYWRPQ